MSTSLTSSSPTTYPQPNEDQIQHSPTKYTPYYTTTSIVGCRGGQNEDTHHSQTSFLPSIGYGMARFFHVYNCSVSCLGQY